MASTDSERRDDEEAPAGEDEDTGAQVAPIVKLEAVDVTTGEEDEDTVLDLYAFSLQFSFFFFDLRFVSLVSFVSFRLFIDLGRQNCIGSIKMETNGRREVLVLLSSWNISRLERFALLWDSLRRLRSALIILVRSRLFTPYAHTIEFLSVLYYIVWLLLCFCSSSINDGSGTRWKW